MFSLLPVVQHAGLRNTGVNPGWAQLVRERAYCLELGLRIVFSAAVHHDILGWGRIIWVRSTRVSDSIQRPIGLPHRITSTQIAACNCDEPAVWVTSVVGDLSAPWTGKRVVRVGFTPFRRPFPTPPRILECSSPPWRTKSSTRLLVSHSVPFLPALQRCGASLRRRSECAGG